MSIEPHDWIALRHQPDGPHTVVHLGGRAVDIDPCEDRTDAYKLALDSLYPGDQFRICGQLAKFRETGGLVLDLTGHPASWFLKTDPILGRDTYAIRKTRGKTRYDMCMDAAKLLTQTYSFEDGFTPEQLCQIASKMRTFVDNDNWYQYQASPEKFAEARHLLFPPPTVEGCQASSAGLKFHYGGSIVCFGRLITNVVLQDERGNDVALGDFHIEIRLEPNREWTAHAIAAGNNQMDQTRRYFHPHVMDQGVCTGSGGAAIRRAIVCGHFCLAIDVLESIMRNYNPDSPYKHLKDWFGPPCTGCGCRDQQLDRCRHCNQWHCHDCLEYCRNCASGYCIECRRMFECHYCKRRTCVSCGLRSPDGDQFCCACNQHAIPDED